jgi:hypothetical protein
VVVVSETGDDFPGAPLAGGFVTGPKPFTNSVMFCPAFAVFVAR